MPGPTPLSDLAKELGEATGYSLAYVYRLLREKGEPVDAEKRSLWRQVVARAARRLTRPDPGRAKAVADVEKVVGASCRKPGRRAALSPGQKASAVSGGAGGGEA